MPKYNVMSPDHRIIIKYAGLIDMPFFLNQVKEWYTKRHYEFHEYSYKAREPQLGELELFWSGWRDDTDYFRVWVNLYIRFWDMEDVEVISKGEKKNMTKARMRINIRFHIETDYRRKWETSRFFVTLRNFYELNMILMKLYLYADKLEYEIPGFISHIKQALGMMD